jgi:hypothetical protein
MAGRLGKEMLTVSQDFHDRVMRIGYGDIGVVKLLLDAGIAVQSSPGLRSAFIVVGNEGYVFTPTALYLKAEPTDGAAFNAIPILGEQVAQISRIGQRCVPESEAVLGTRLAEISKLQVRAKPRGDYPAVNAASLWPKASNALTCSSSRRS